MKVFVQLCFTAIIFFIISKISVTNYNLAIYGIFIGLLSYLLYNDLNQAYQIKKATLCKGTIINTIRQSEGIYHIDIKFISPFDNKEHIVKTKSKILPDDKSIDIVFNKKNPSNSKIYRKPKVLQISLLTFGILFFLYKFFINISAS